MKQKYPVPARDKDAYTRALSEVDGKKGLFFSKMPEVDQLLKLEPDDPNNVPHDLHVKRLSFMASVAPNTLKIISGGPKSNDPEKDLIDTTRAVMDSGNEGRIVGRNFWGRPLDEALELNKLTVDLMRQKAYRRKLKEARFR